MHMQIQIQANVFCSLSYFRYDFGQTFVLALDGPIRANRFRVPELNPLFCESRLGALKIANRRFEEIRANRSNVMNIGFFLRIDSHESPRFALRIAGPSTVLAWWTFRNLLLSPVRGRGEREE